MFDQLLELESHVTMSTDKYRLMFEPLKEIGFENLKKIMNIILKVADAGGDHFDKHKMKSELIKKLMETWNKKSYQKRVNIFDEPFSPRPKGHMWRILIPFDRFTYPIEFRLVRRNALKTLKDLALNAVTSIVRNGLQIDKLELEVPDTLKMSMKQDCYARKQFPKFEPYEISLTKEQQFSEILKRKHERRRQIQVRKTELELGLVIKGLRSRWLQ